MRIDSTDKFYIGNHIEKDHLELYLNRKNSEDKEIKHSLTGKDLVQAVKKTNEKLEVYNRRLEFTIHEKTRDIMVKVVDSNTNEIIREIPPEKLIDMVANMLENAGILVNERI